MSFVKDLFSSPSPPGGVDPSQLAATQGAANEGVARLSAKLNRVNTYTPSGSVTFDDLGDDRWSVNQTLSPGMQGLFDQQTEIGGGINDAALSRLGSLSDAPFSLEGLPEYQSSIDTSGLMGIPGADSLDAYATRAEDAAFSKFSDRFEPQVDRDRAALENQLANQGITEGSDAYKDQISQFDQGVNDARTSATYDSVAQGASMRSSLLADALTGRQQGISEAYTEADAANRGRAQEIDDRLLERTQGLNELAALLTGQSAISLPTQQPTAQVGVGAPDVGGAYALSQAAKNNAYNQQISSRNAAQGGLFGLGSAYLLS